MSTAAAANASNSTEVFFKLLKQSQLLNEADVDDWQQLTSSLNEPNKVAAQMIKQGAITNFQARQLLAGRHRGFFLGSYKILDQLGQGGMGIVYSAEHTTLRRKVALKVLASDKARDRVSLERFYREARSAAALDHQNIVKLHDISQGAGVHFLVMEYVEGVTLDELIEKTGAMHYSQVVQYIAQVAQGLKHAHDKGFVHRDIKPANLILEKGGAIKILDMGLARSFEKPEDNLTAQLDEQTVMGTVDYIAPEQALRKPADQRSDIYSLGATFFNLITGHAPFNGTTAQKLMGHQMTEVPKLSKLRASVPPAMNGIVAKMMAKNPKDRFQNCGELLDALSPWMPADTQNSVVMSGPIKTESLNGTKVEQRRNSTTRKSLTKKQQKKLAKLKKKNYIYAASGAGGVVVIFLLTWLLWPNNNKPLESTGRTDKNSPVSRNDVTDSKVTQFDPSQAVVDVSFGQTKKETMNFGNDVFTFALGSNSWVLNSWKKNETGALEWIDHKGQSAVALRNTRGTSGQLYCYYPVRCYKGDQYLTRIQYATNEKARALFILRPTSDVNKEFKIDLSHSNNWKTLERVCTIPESGELALFIQNQGNPEPDSEIFIRQIQIYKMKSGTASGTDTNSSTTKFNSTAVLYKSDMNSVEPFQLTKQGSNTVEGEGGAAGFHMQCYLPNSKAKFAKKTIWSVPVLGMEHLEGDVSCQFYCSLDSVLKSAPHGATLEFSIEYSTEGTAEAIARVQQDGKNYNTLADRELTSSTDAWRKVQFQHVIDEKEPAGFAINMTKPGGWVYIKAITVTQVPGN